MIKFTQGAITNPVTGVKKDIVVKAVSPNSLRDIVIGGGLMLVGAAYLASTAFKNGAQAMEAAEFNTLSDLDLTWASDEH